MSIQNSSTDKLIINKSHLAYGLLMAYDLIAVALSFFIALWLRFDCQISKIPSEYFSAYKRFIPWYLVICIGIFTYVKLYNSIWRFASLIELERVSLATAITVLLHTSMITVLFRRMPVSYYVMGGVFQYASILGIRFSYRLLVLITARRNASHFDNKPVMIIGAGTAGREVIREIRRTVSLKEEPVCIIDDDELKQGKEIDGVQIVGGRDSILANADKYNVKKIYLAIPSADRKSKRDILHICSGTECEIMSLPGIYQIAEGKVTLADMKKVEIEDLLGRDVVKTDMDEICSMICDKVVLITGGGGSIGSEIALQVSRHNPKQLIIFDIYENNAYDIQHRILEENPQCNLEVLIGSVRDSRRVNDIFCTYRPDLVYHAAAHKHVPLMEYSPCEAIKNNVVGTYKVAYAAMMYGTKRFVLISTDKAVNPTNIMGASKRMCELIIQAFDRKIKEGKANEIPPLYIHEESPEKMYPTFSDYNTEFVAVRFGNVLGSNGSVIPLFKEQIKRGGPITVTHPDIIRYFMTIPEAASLVLSAGTYAKGGEIFVLDMGDPVKIDDLARNLIKLSGLKPDVDIKIEYTGLRPGEKLYEEKLMSEEGLIKTSNELIHIGKPIEFDADRYLKSLNILMKVAYENTDAIKLMVEELVDTYHPTRPLSLEEKAEYDREIGQIVSGF